MAVCHQGATGRRLGQGASSNGVSARFSDTFMGSLH